MNRVLVVGELDANFAWDGRQLYQPDDFRVTAAVPRDLRGAAAAVDDDGQGRWRILRDPLGLNKLFWARSADTVLVAARPRRLIERGCAFEDIRAVPRGHVFDFDGAGSVPVQHAIQAVADDAAAAGNAADVDAVAADIRRTLHGYFDALAAAYPGARVFVCLSGGLDSAGIAALAREHFADVVAVSFDLVRPSGPPSEDRRIAARLARDLGLPLLCATSTADALLAALDTVLVEGIDWRDFNVHAGLVNAALAAAVAEAAASGSPQPSPLVLTGDLANEFLVDYEPQPYRGSVHYRLPTLPPSALRASLVRGLDSCHREVGVFAAWGLALVQPYAVAVDAYLALPEAFLALGDRKQRLARSIFGSRIPDYVYARPKVRAQAGNADASGGVLAACLDRGIEGAWLRQRFAALHGAREPWALDRFIRAGRYRAGLPSAAGVDR